MSCDILRNLMPELNLQPYTLGYSIDLYGHAQAELEQIGRLNFPNLNYDGDYVVPDCMNALRYSIGTYNLGIL